MGGLDQPLRTTDYARLSTQLLSGLAFLHSNGVMHRDIKPANLLLSDSSPQAELKISDFGLCALLRAADDEKVSGLAWRAFARRALVWLCAPMC